MTIEEKIKYELRKHINEYIKREGYTYCLSVEYSNDSLYIYYSNRCMNILTMRYKNCKSFKEIDCCIIDYVKFFHEMEVESLSKENNLSFNAELKNKFSKELEQLINKNSIDCVFNIPDYILSDYLINCLETFNNTKKQTEKWKGEI